MARPFSGQKYVKSAQSLRDHAQTASELRQALAVLLPLESGLNLKQTAAVLGRSREATCRLRTEFIARQAGRDALGPSAAKVARQKRMDEEARLLDEVLSEAAQDGVVVVPPLKPLVEARLGKTICLATLYNMLMSSTIFEGGIA